MDNKQKHMYGIIEDYYKKNRKVLVRRFAHKAGSYHNAEDVVQEAFTRALQYWSTYNVESNMFEEWFGRILSNCLRTFNNDRRRQGMSLDEEEVVNLTFEPPYYFKKFLREIEQDVLSQPESIRRILELALFEHLPFNDVSILANSTPGAVRNIVYRFRNELKQKYDESFHRGHGERRIT